MPRPRTGKIYVEWHVVGGVRHPDIRFDLPSGERSGRGCLPEGTSLEDAKAEARRLKAIAWAKGGRLIRSHDAEQGESIDRYADRWLATRRDPKEARAHLRCHLLDVLGWDRPVVAITKDDVERVVRDLDGKVRSGTMRAKTARNIFGTLTKLLDDACSAKDLALRVLADRPNPADKVRGPDRGEDRQSAWLFPREASTLLACEAVPLRWRRVYALAFYTGLRSGELAVLRVGDVVLEGGYLAVHKARDRVTGGTKSTKGKRARRVPIELALRPLLEDLTAGRARDELLVDVPPKQKMAEELRTHLKRAGLDREELFADDADRRPFSFHDGRHTFAVWLALTGAPELTIQSRLGHASAEMTQHYINEAEAVGHGDVGEPFGALPSTILSPDRLVPANGTQAVVSKRNSSGVDGTRTRGLRRDRPAL